MVDMNDPINKFMDKKNKESLGEATETENVAKEDPALSNIKTRKTFDDGESISKDDAKAVAMIRRFMNMALIIPLAIIFLVGVFYVVLQLLPTFLIMIIGFIPWGEFGDASILSFSEFLTGNPLGTWYFMDATLWFLIIGIIIGIINKQGEKGIVENFVSGAADMMSVVLIIAVARGASYLMGVTYLDNYIIYSA